jgi:hypothetical protein
MSNALTDSLTVWATWTQTTLSDPTWSAAHGIQAVIYGDQQKIAVSPTICIEPSSKPRTFNGLPRKTEIDFEAAVLVYFGSLADTQTTRKNCDILAEAVEARLHTFPTCGGLVISSLVSNLESGVANKGGTLMRAARLTWTAKSQVMLPLYDPNNP